MLRAFYKTKRNELSRRERQEASLMICDRIKQLASYRVSNHIALYFPVKSEVDLTSLWDHALSIGKSCYFPVIQEDRSLRFVKATHTSTFKLNRYQIKEPEGWEKEVITLEALDIVCLPMVAFDKYGHRLGMGGGCYDRTFKGINSSLRIGVAFECQQHKRLPQAPWDVPVTVTITERQNYWAEES